MRNYITDYYKDLFGPHELNDCSLEENFRENITQVSEVENEVLIEAFSEKEVKEAFFEMEYNKAPGPDGFPTEYFQHFWDIMKPDLMELFNEFHKGKLPLHSLNFGIITLLPKKN